MAAEASAGGLKRITRRDGAAGAVTEYPVVGDGGKAKIKVTSEGVVEAVLPSMLEAEVPQGADTGARLATDMEIARMPDEVLFCFSAPQIEDVSTPEPAVVAVRCVDGTVYEVVFASKWSCAAVADALRHHAAAGRAARDAADASVAAALQQSHEHAVGMRVGSMPLRGRMSCLLAHAAGRR